MPDEFEEIFDQIADEEDQPTGPEQDKQQESDSAGEPSQAAGAGPENTPPAQDPETDPNPEEDPEQSGQHPESEKVPGQDPGQDPDQDKQSQDEQDKDKKSQDQDDPDQLEDLRKKAHGYDSMKGRLEKERQERRKLEERLARLEGRQPGTDPAPAQDQSGSFQQSADQQARPQEAEIPEDLQEDVSDFASNYADYAHLIKEDSQRGKVLRNLLQEYGPDMAAVKAENIAIQDRIQSQEQEKQVRQYWDRIGQDHPEVVQAFARADQDPTAVQEFAQALNDWIASKPSWLAPHLESVRDGADPQAAAELISTFKEETGWGSSRQQADQADPALADPKGPADPAEPADAEQNPQKSPEQSRQKPGRPASDPQAAAAVPGRPSPPPRSRPSKDDFDAAWEEANKNP